MNLLERETVITFNEQEQFAEVFTYNPRMKRELAALAISRPNETKKIKTNGVGGETYTVPKKWVKIRANRILTHEQRQELQERARALRGNQILAKQAR